jgi:hypothetical protein
MDDANAGGAAGQTAPRKRAKPYDSSSRDDRIPEELGEIERRSRLDGVDDQVKRIVQPVGESGELRYRAGPTGGCSDQQRRRVRGLCGRTRDFYRRDAQSANLSSSMVSGLIIDGAGVHHRW